MKYLKKFIKWSLLSLLVLVLLIGLVNVYIIKQGKKNIYKHINDVPQAQAVIILGALVYKDGSLSPILKDRVLCAMELYDQGKVEKFLVSGDHGREYYDEVNAIKDYLLANGIPAEDIFLDHAGFDTYDSLYRARAIFQIDSLVIATQEFHLSRSVYIADSLGLQVSGLAADRQQYYGMVWNQSREVLSRFKAFINVMLIFPPKYLGDVIPITGDSSLSWD